MPGGPEPDLPHRAAYGFDSDSSLWRPIKVDSTGTLVSAAQTVIVGIPTTVVTTDANDKTVKTPGTGKKYRLKFVYVWNSSGADRTINGFKFGSGSYHFIGKLGDKTGFAMNLTGCPIEGAANEALVFKASGADVQITVIGEEI